MGFVVFLGKVFFKMAQSSDLAAQGVAALSKAQLKKYKAGMALLESLPLFDYRMDLPAGFGECLLRLGDNMLRFRKNCCGYG